MSAIESICKEHEEQWTDAHTTDKDYYIPEKYQLGILSHYLRDTGFQYTTEAQILEFPIDVLAVKRDTAIAIEMKSTNSKRGVIQAKRNAKLVDYSFLSVWEENVTDHLIERVADTNVGLISVSNDLSFLSPPKKSEKILCSMDNLYSILNKDV